MTADKASPHLSHIPAAFHLGFRTSLRNEGHSPHTVVREVVVVTAAAAAAVRTD